MFILKFDGFDSTNSTKNHIRVYSGAFIYDVTIEYDDISSKKIVSMKDVSALSSKKNDCIIEMNNLQGFIMQDFVLFIQIDKEKKGMLNFKNWSTSSTLTPIKSDSSTAHLSAGYEIDIIHTDQILHFGKLSLINSGINVVNKVEVLKWEFYDKENQKLSINDFELAVNNLDLNMGFIESQEKDKEIAELKAKLIGASNEITNLQEKLKECDNKPITPIITDLSKHTVRYILSQPMQKYSFGNSYFSVDNNSYTADLKNTNRINTWWNDFETKFNLKKENLLISESDISTKDALLTLMNNDGVTISGVSKSFNTTMQRYSLFSINIEKLGALKYKITFRTGRSGYVTSQGLMMNTIGVNNTHTNSLDKAQFFYIETEGIFPAYSFTIENVTIKTDTTFKFDGIEKSEYTADGVKRFIEFEYDLLNKPKVTVDGYSQDYTTKFFPKFFEILQDWIVK